MANLSGSNFTKMTTEGVSHNVPQQVSSIFTIIINSISCPFTVLLNVLVIMAVKRRPRLQSNTNILLACLAATDVLTGLIVQPSYIVWQSMDLFNGIDGREVRVFHNTFIRVLSICSSFQLMLVTCERLIAIKLTVHYHILVTPRNIKVAEIVVWACAHIFELVRLTSDNALIIKIHNLFFSLGTTFCVLFIISAYIVLYRETRRHEKKIKAQQLTQGEVERFAKENKALKTTVIVVGVVALSFLPMAVTVLTRNMGLREQKEYEAMYDVLSPLVRTCAMLNSLLNPLIYCLRQKEMRRFVLRFSSQVVEPSMRFPSQVVEPSISLAELN